MDLAAHAELKHKEWTDVTVEQYEKLVQSQI
jgi:hypothetical protein